MTAVVYGFPGADRRLEAAAAVPADVLGLVELAAGRLGELAELVRAAAPGTEITAAAEAVEALRGPLASLQVTGEALAAAHRAGEARARDALSAFPPRLHTIPGGNGTPGGAA